MKLIVGLGNPGTAYEHTRHNVGFLVVDALADEARWSAKRAFQSEMTEIDWNGEKTILVKPQTFMNRSGEAVQAIAAYYKIPVTNMLVIHDEADLPFGDVRMQAGRSAAGHNGVQSIIDAFQGSKDFSRVRVGVGRPADPMIPLDAWVLSPWGPEEKKELPEVIKKAVTMLSAEIR